MKEAIAVSVASPSDRAFFDQLSGVLFSPAKEFKAIARQARYRAPLLAGIALVAGLTAAWFSRLDTRAYLRNEMKVVPATQSLTAEQREQLVEMRAPFYKPLMIGVVCIGDVILVAVVAALYLFVFRLMYGTEMTFSQSLAVVAWTSLAADFVSGPLTLAFYFMKGNWNLNPFDVFQANLAVLLDREHAAPSLYALASKLDLCAAWQLWLLALGFGAAMKKRAATALPGVLGLWAIYVLLRVIQAAA